MQNSLLVGTRNVAGMKKTITIPVTVQGLARLHEALAKVFESMNLPEKLKFKANLVVEEICANHVEHGHFSNDDTITVMLELTESLLIIKIEDEGTPFNPLDVPATDTTLCLEERAQGGLGIHFVKHFADDLAYTREGPKNVIIITKKI